MNLLLRSFWLAAFLTLAIWGGVFTFTGTTGLVTVVILTVLEITFSADNAIVNSKLLKFMSPLWQKLFMTVGILIAVFVVRFALPIFIVQLTAGLGFTDVVKLTLYQPDVYSQYLVEAVFMLDAFGGTFLLMIGIGYFLDAEKDTHWLGPIESRLARWGRLDNLPIFAGLIGALVMYFTVDDVGHQRIAVLVAALAGIALHVGLDVLGAAFDSGDDGDEEDTAARVKPTVVLVGGAAAVIFLRLELLDASFSFDGVVGAFAITNDVLIIMAGLGAGAMWVRAMTTYLVRAGTLAKFRYLENGAHWAITVLGAVMVAKLYKLTLPEWATGSLGIVFIALAVTGSVIAQRREDRRAELDAYANTMTPVYIRSVRN